MTADDLRDYLVTTLVRRHGGERRHWRIALGAVKVYDIATHPHCNWAVSPSGGADKIGAIERLVDDVRAVYPHISTGLHRDASGHVRVRPGQGPAGKPSER